MAVRLGRTQRARPHGSFLWEPLRLFIAVGLVLALAGCHPTGDVKVADLAFEGNTVFKDGDLRQVMATRKSSWMPWSKPHFFDRELFQADLDRLRAFYEDRGYPNARISVAEIAFNDARDSVRIRVAIDEGAPIVVERLEIAGLDDITDQAIRDALDSLPLRQGAPFDRARLSETVEHVGFALRDRGYPNARIDVKEQGGADPTRVIVTLATSPGTLTSFGEISIVGNKSVSENLVRRSLAFRPGQLYRESRVLESQRRLAALDLFDFAHITGRAEDATSAAGTLPMDADDVESQTDKFAGSDEDEDLDDVDETDEEFEEDGAETGDDADTADEADEEDEEEPR